MAFTTLSEVHLIQLELDIDNKNQLDFSNETAQLTFFNGVANRQDFTNLTYIRKDRYVVVPIHIDLIYKYNYLYYKNPYNVNPNNTSNKWIFSFISGYEYLSENSTRVYIKTDVWQTYQFNIIFKKSFVEREMIAVASDTRGANLEPEDIETGEYMTQEILSTHGLGICYVLACSKDPSTIAGTGASTSLFHGNLVNNIASGLWYYIGNYSKVLEMVTIISSDDPNDIIAIYSIPTVSIYGWSQDYTLSELDNPQEVWRILV